MKAPRVTVSDHPWDAIIGFLKMNQAYTVPRQSCITIAAAIHQRPDLGILCPHMPLNPNRKWDWGRHFIRLSFDV
jgi:hypothetical protein